MATDEWFEALRGDFKSFTDELRIDFRREVHDEFQQIREMLSSGGVPSESTLASYKGHQDRSRRISCTNVDTGEVTTSANVADMLQPDMVQPNLSSRRQSLREYSTSSLRSPTAGPSSPTGLSSLFNMSPRSKNNNKRTPLKHMRSFTAVAEVKAARRQLDSPAGVASPRLKREMKKPLAKINTQVLPQPSASPPEPGCQSYASEHSPPPRFGSSANASTDRLGCLPILETDKGETEKSPPEYLSSKAYRPSSLSMDDTVEDSLLGRLVNTTDFDVTIGILVLINSVMIGLQTDYTARHREEGVPIGFRICEVVFCCIFVTELLLRVLVFRTYYFRMPGWQWNAFDMLVVGLQVAEEAVVAVVSHSRRLPLNFSFLRVLRVLRLIRIARTLRVLRLIGELRGLVTALFHSLSSLAWTIALLVLMLFTVGVVFTQLVSDSNVTGDSVHADLEFYYGSLVRTMLTLFQCITGGVDWNEAVRPLSKHVSPLMEPLFAFYIALTVLAFLNVVTGCFCKYAMDAGKRDKDYFMINNVRELFRKSAGTMHGLLTWEDFDSQRSCPEMKEYFRAIDVDVSEAKDLFKLLDTDGDGTIDAEEFLSGVLRLRGTAQSIDLALVAQEVWRISAQLQRWEEANANAVPMSWTYRSHAEADAGPGVGGQPAIKKIDSDLEVSSLRSNSHGQ